jgi:hypothetical protein
MIQRTLTLYRAVGTKAKITLGIADSWDDRKTMEVLVPELRRTYPPLAGDRFVLEPIDPTKD